MELNKFSVVLAILLISILAIGAVSAESVDDSDALAISDDVVIDQSVEPTDTVDDLSAADTADETVGDADSAVLSAEPSSYDLDDDTYSTYFKEDGTATDALSADGDYTLNVGTLTNKDIKIASGSNINITAKEGAGVINNGTIYIGAGDGMAGSIIVSGLTFTNTNKNAIDISEYSTDITVKGNTMNLVGVGSEDNPYLTVTAIAPHNYIYDLKIVDNKITVTGDAPYSNGIYAMNWQAAESPSNFNISGNTFTIDCSSTSGSIAALYVECSDSIIEDNVIDVKSVGSTIAYGIQVPDSAYNTYMAAGYEGTVTSPKNFAIKNNKVNVDSEYMAYGITLISYGAEGYDEETLMYLGMNFPNVCMFPLNIEISDNVVFIRSDKGVMGIAGQAYEMTIKDNNLTVIGGSAEGVSSSDMLGVGPYAIGVQYNGGMAEDDYYVTVTGNNIYSSVAAEFLNNDDYEEYVTFENTIVNLANEDGEFLVTEDTFDILFDEKGNLKSLIPAGSTVLLGDLEDKKLNINIPLTIKAIPKEDEEDIDPCLRNTVINLVEGADGTVIDGLYFNFYGDETTGSIGLIYAKAVENITIKNNRIHVGDFVDKEGAKYGSSVYPIELESGATGCNNALITENEITVYGSSRYIYGIDVFQSWGSENKNNNVNITKNNVTVVGASRMSEPIYVSGSSDVLIADNIVSSESYASAYGIATDSLSNAVIKDNTIRAGADERNAAMAYAVTATNGNGITIEANAIESYGAGAVGIGIMGDNGVEIKDNTISIDGGDYITTTTGDSLGTANAAILNKSGNENINIGENDITEKGPIFINNENYANYFNADGTIKDDSDIAEGSYIVLDKLTNKTIVIDVLVRIEGTSIDTGIVLVAGADGTVITSLDMQATVSSGSFALIYAKEVRDIRIEENNLIISCNNDLSTWDMIMPIEIEGGALGCEDVTITFNNITVTGAAPYVYGIDVFKTWDSESYLKGITIDHNNIDIDVDSSMTEGIYLSGLNSSSVYGNEINAVSNDSSYGIGTDNLYDVYINDNDITVEAGGMAYGITVTVAGKDVSISSNALDVTGAGAMGIGIAGQDGASIENNDITIDGGDYSSITSNDVLGLANAAIVEGSGNTNTNIGNNDVDEYSDIKLEFADLTVTAANSGKGSFKVVVKTMDGKVLADKDITFTFNNKVYKETTDENGVATLEFDLNKKGKYSVNIAFLGDKQYKGALAISSITINPVKTTLTSSAKTYLATAKTKALTATLKDANGKALAKKKVTFTVNGKTVTATTNAKGVATAKLALKAAKTYTVTIKFAGDNVYAASTKSVKVKLNKEKTKVTAPKKTFKKSAKTKKVVITLKNSKGKAIAKKKVTLIVNKKKFTAKTNKKGKATIKVKLTKKGTNKYTVKFAGDSQYKASKKAGKIIIK